MPKLIDAVKISREQGNLIRRVISEQKKRIADIAEQIGVNQGQLYLFFRGEKAVKKEGAEELYLQLHSDNRIEFLKNIVKEIEETPSTRDVNYSLRNLYDSYSLRLRNVLNDSPEKVKIQLIGDLEALTEKYSSKP